MKMDVRSSADPAVAKSQELAAIAQAEITKVRLRITVPEFQFEDTFSFSSDDPVITVKQKTLTSLNRDLNDSLNYGLYCPATKDRAGKFLDEERPLKDYPLEGPIALLELRYKRRVFKSSEADATKLKKINIQQNLKAFLDCVKKSEVDKITKWTAKGIDPNFNSIDKGETPMTVAATLLRPRPVMMALVSGGAYIDYRNRLGLTPIHVAAKEGNKDAIRTLLDLGSSPNYKDGNGLTAMFYCVSNNTDSQCLQMLLHERADIGFVDDKGNTEVHHACLLGLAQHLEDLLFYGADMNSQNHNGDTPLHVCAKNNKENCARTLMFRGADKKILNNAKHTAAEAAQLALNKELADTITNFNENSIVLYKDLPKYNEKRRGAINIATIRNLQRSRSNPQLHELFYDNNNWTSSLSPATAKQILNNGYLQGSHGSKYGTGRVDMSPPRPTTQEIFSSGPAEESPKVNGNQGHALSSQWEEKLILIDKGNASFGFVLRGPSFSREGSNGTFTPTDELPARQYIETVERGSASDRAGLRDGDFILEINGEDVVYATHNHCVSVLKSNVGILKMKICRKKADSVLRNPPVLTVDRTKSQMDGLAELERLDETLDNYDHEAARASHYAAGATAVRESHAAPDLYRTSEGKAQDVVPFTPTEFQDDIPAPDYEEEEEYTNYSKENGFNSNGTVEDEIPKRPSTLELSLQQAVRDRESRQISDVKISTQSSTNAQNIPVPPPPPPLLPTPSDSLPGVSTIRRSEVPPHVKQQLEEAKKREESHAALMAAVLERRKNIETDDGDDSKANKPKKVQVVHPAGDKKDFRASSVEPTTVNGSSNEVKASFTDTSGSTNPYSTGQQGGFVSEAERALQLYVQQKMATLPRNSSKPPVSSESLGVSTNLSNGASSIDTGADTSELSSHSPRPESSSHSPRPESSISVAAKSPVRDQPAQPALANIAQFVAQKALERQQNDTLKTEPNKPLGSSKVYSTRVDTPKINNEIKNDKPIVAAEIKTAEIKTAEIKTADKPLVSIENKNPVKPLVINNAHSTNGPVISPASNPAQSKSPTGFSTSYSSNYTRNSTAESRPLSPPRNKFADSKTSTLSRTSNNNNTSSAAPQLNSSRFRPADFPTTTSMSSGENIFLETKSAPKAAAGVNNNKSKVEINSAPVGGYQRKTALETNHVSSYPPVKSPNTVKKDIIETSAEDSVQNRIATLNRTNNTKSYTSNPPAPSNFSKMNGKPDAPTRKTSQLTSPEDFIPPPAEFGTSPPKSSEFITTTLRKVDNKQGQSNSMVFRASAHIPPVNTSQGYTNGFSPSSPLKPYQTKKIEAWTPSDVGDWLESLNYEEYVKVFSERHITGPMLVRAAQNQIELSSYGVLNVLHKIKLEREIKKYVTK